MKHSRQKRLNRDTRDTTCELTLKRTSNCFPAVANNLKFNKTDFDKKKTESLCDHDLQFKEGRTLHIAKSQLKYSNNILWISRHGPRRFK